jgi:DNA-binding MarR family transcriptional regulator
MSAVKRGASALSAALRGYLDARATALLTARKALGINELDARALLYLLDNPGSKPSALSAVLGLTSAGVTVLTDRLVGRDIVRRDPDPADRRSVRLTATVDIAQSPWSALTAFDAGLEGAVTELDASEAERLAELISGLTRRAAG